MSGRTRSMPSMSSCGNMRPASTTRSLFPHSSAHMLMPTSPRPPSGTYRSLEAIYRGPREVTAKPRTSCGISQQVELLGFLFVHRRRLRRRRRREEPVQVLADVVEVTLEVSHQRPVVQCGRRMVERHVCDLATQNQAAVNSRDRALAGQEPFERMPAEDQHNLGLDQPQLPLQVWLAGLGLVRHRVAVLRGTALEHVGDVYVGTAHPDTAQKRVE